MKDRKILYQLDVNSRQSFSQIGKKVGLPKNVVSYRIKKLQNSGIINKFYTVIDTFKLGYSSFRIYLGFQYVSPTIEKEIINHFSKNKLNWWTISSDGRFNLVVIMWIKEINDFYSFWEDTLKKYRDYFYIQQFSIYIQTQSFLNEYLIGSEYIVDRLEYIISGASIDRKIDPIDINLLQIIGNDARISIRDVSDILGITFNAVKQRFKKLKKLGIILGFRVEIDYKKLGYQFYKADINLTNYAMRSQILQYIKQNPNLIRIDKSIGISDLELEFLVPTHEYFYKIMDDLQFRFQTNIKNYQYLCASSYCDIKYFPKI